jgi:ribosome-binding factor A
MSQRTDRLDSQIRSELMELIQREMKDPRLAFVTITRVETSRDLGFAKVWVSVYGSDQERDQTMDALDSAAPWLRRRLAQRLHVRQVPELSMRRDESIEGGDRVLRLLRQLEEERSAPSEGASSGEEPPEVGR